jgi:hypothetical protein
MESMLQSRLPRTAPRRRKLTPWMKPSLWSWYRCDRRSANRWNAPGESQNSASLAGDAVTEAVVLSVSRPPILLSEYFIGQ